MNNNTLVLTGGGTAGHVMVNINLENEFFKHFKKIVYIGSKGGIESELVPKLTKYKYEAISSVKFDRRKIFKAIAIPFKLKKAVSEAYEKLKFYNPAVVFSKGGYVGLPVVIAAKKLNIPVVCHESDLSLGLANKLAKKYANAICTSFKKTAETGGKKCIHTSIPLKLSPLSKQAAKQKLGITSPLPILLITGGSLGAKAINQFVFENIDEICKKYYVLHQVGKGNLNKELQTKENYKQFEFSNDMQLIFKASDFALSRAGANTTLELLANNILTIFVPLPKKVSRGDQIENAKYFEDCGAAKLIFQEDLTAKLLFETLKDLQKNSSHTKAQIKAQNICDGTQNILSVILKEAKNQL